MVDLSLVKPKHLWYIVGLIATDGNLSSDKRHINITSKDRSILISVKKALKLRNKITKKARAKGELKKYFFLQFGDVNFYKYLVNIGLTPQKSLTLKSVTVPDVYFFDFFRGIIDGDGSISTWVHKGNKNIQWSLRIFSGSSNFVSWLKEKVENTCKVNGRMYKSHRENRNPLYTIKFGKIAAQKIIQSCYYQKCLSLDRKFKKATECLRAENLVSKYGNVLRV